MNTFIENDQQKSRPRIEDGAGDIITGWVANPYPFERWCKYALSFKWILFPAGIPS